MDAFMEDYFQRIDRDAFVCMLETSPDFARGEELLALWPSNRPDLPPLQKWRTLRKVPFDVFVEWVLREG